MGAKETCVSPWLGFGLAAALALTLALVWFGYPPLHHQAEAVVKTDNVQKTVDGLGDRLKTFDAGAICRACWAG